MMASIKSEFRKLTSIRSTYFISGLALLIVMFYSFYIEGIRVNAQSLADPSRLASEPLSAIAFVSILIALVGLLLLTHEYRYNTIMYTLTASKSRTRILLAKIMVISGYALVMSLLVGILAPTMAYLGAHASGHVLVHQVFPIWSLLWRTTLYGWGYAMAALLFAALIRSQVGAIIALFVLPGTAETLVGLLLKNNTVYLPFTALSQVIAVMGAKQGPIKTGHLSPSKGAFVFCTYLIIGWLVAWALFLRRDAN